MMRPKRVIGSSSRLLIIAAAAFATACAAPGIDIQRQPQALAITGAMIVDPQSNSPPARATVVIVGDRILRTNPAVRPPRGASVINARGKYLLPGLWDMHAHLAALNEVGSKPENYVGHGVLAVRDMGGFLDKLQLLKSEIAAGRPGPTVLIAGPTLNGRSFADHHRVVTNEAEGRAAVRELKAAGVDLIKVHRALSPEVFPAILDEGRRVGLPVAGHVPLGVSWIDASKAGFHIEHTQTLVENEVADRKNPAKDAPDAIRRLDGARGDAIFAELARNGTYFDPTLIQYENSIDNATSEIAVRRRELYKWLKFVVGRANAAGVAILAGTDMVVEQPGKWLPVELERLVEAGLTIRQALAAATSTAARAAGRPDLARIAPGATASLLILNDDPLQDIGNVREPFMVILRGRIIDAPELSRMRSLKP